MSERKFYSLNDFADKHEDNLYLVREIHQDMQEAAAKLTKSLKRKYGSFIVWANFTRMIDASKDESVYKSQSKKDSYSVNTGYVLSNKNPSDVKNLAALDKFIIEVYEKDGYDQESEEEAQNSLDLINRVVSSQSHMVDPEDRKRKNRFMAAAKKQQKNTLNMFKGVENEIRILELEKKADEAEAKASKKSSGKKGKDDKSKD